jgi:ATP-binding cassette subfamily B protein
MFMTYMAILTWPMIGLGWVVNLVQRGTASLARLNELLAQRPEIADSEQTDYSISEVRGDIELRHVTVFHPGSETPALDDVSLYVPTGQTLAIVGPTGAGKSTLVSLIPRLLDPQRGSVLIDGVDVRRIPLVVLRRSIGVVPQETFLFSDTVRANVLLGAPDDGRLERVAETSQLAAAIPELPKGYDTMLGERGVTLSGGERQRLAIARALLRDAPILLLDEATSALDAESEHAIAGALDLLMRGRTTLVIAHRLATAQRANRIVVMDRGRIVASGTHSELVRQGGLYARLAALQFNEGLDIAPERARTAVP